MNLDTLIDSYGAQLPLLYEFQTTPQDPQWHAEGNVHIHTQLVLDQLAAMLPTQPPHLHKTLLLSALLHDIAKPLCTREIEIDGQTHIAAPHHESKGRSYLATRLLPPLVSWEEHEQISGCVGAHHLPKRLVKKDLSKGQYLRCARLADPALLYQLERADMLGRVCRDQQEQVDIVELFWLQMQEYAPDGWLAEGKTLFERAMVGRPSGEVARAFGEATIALEDGQIQSFEEGLFFSHQHKGFCPELVLLIGPSGAGKTTWVKNQSFPYVLVSLDAIREEFTGSRLDQSQNGQVRQEARARVKAGLRAGKRMIYEATNLQKERRAQLIAEARAYHALVTLVVFQLPYAQYLAQNRQRLDALPDQVVENQLAGMDWPEVTEAHRVIWVRAGQDRVQLL